MDFSRRILTTDRLLLRPLGLSDAHDVQRLAGDKSVAEGTSLIPHPYEDGMAEAWISTHQRAFDAGEQAVFAITLKPSRELIGCIRLSIAQSSLEAELGYWVGKPFWRRGYCTEAARAVLCYGFSVLNMKRICAAHFHRNPASGRVLRKIGMVHEGSTPKAVAKWGKLLDVEHYGMKQGDWMAAQNKSDQKTVATLTCFIGERVAPKGDVIIDGLVEKRSW
ncbi:hypothetical protein BSKO_11083 [Bryopsis sp. KO-2023]|nr:hypothetical protein BSKO_11083 [Bryopsis sp. KO-2023]